MINMIKLKGGSLSSTYLCELNGKKFVRKLVHLDKDREYGFVRWYSQLKKMQHYNSVIPGVFPEIIQAGYLDSTNSAYFDLEFMDNYTDIKTLFSQHKYEFDTIKKITHAFCDSLDKIHNNKLSKIAHISNLYFREEIEQKLFDAAKHASFNEFFKYETYFYNGERIEGINKYFDKLRFFFEQLTLDSEEMIHGNPTLENALYSFNDNKVVFIDPYEESIIDSKLLDYSQVLQCSNSGYGYINDRNPSVYDNFVKNNLKLPKSFSIFNNIFIDRNITKNTEKTINILEASQFIRMLPFKCATGDIEKAKFFYVHACYLIQKQFLNESV